MKFWAAVTLLLVVRAEGLKVRNVSAYDGDIEGGYTTSIAFTVDKRSLPDDVESKPKVSGDPPGEDRDPAGVVIYDSLDAVPTARLLARGTKQAKCFRRGGQSLLPYVCGHRCEQILLAVDGFCKRGGDCGGVNECGEWRRCKKARKFHRCFARVCYRGGRGGAPGGYEDTSMVAIVRYRRPLPRHEVLARRNRQSSTQSAIFK